MGGSKRGSNVQSQTETEYLRDVEPGIRGGQQLLVNSFGSNSDFFDFSKLP